MSTLATGRMLRRYLFAAIYLLVASGALAADFSLSNFTLESSERVFGIPATWDLTYRADATNETLDDYADLRLVIDAPPDVIEVIDGDLHFGAVPAGASAPSLDTFTLRESRRDLRSDYPYPPEDLQWVLWTPRRWRTPEQTRRWTTAPPQSLTARTLTISTATR